MFSKASRELGRSLGLRHHSGRWVSWIYTIPQHIILAFLLEMDPGPACPSLCPHHPPGGMLSACLLAGRLCHVPTTFACLGIRCPSGFGCHQWLLHRKGEIRSLPLPILAGAPEQALTLLGPSLQRAAGLVRSTSVAGSSPSP